jgi:REP element-mobilizing transposase RayT
MVYDPAIHHRRSIRLRTHDYATGGLYYVTICAAERRRLFGVVVNSHMVLNDAGRMATHWFYELENKCPDVRCDAFVCMPDHVHFVVRTGNGGEHIGSPLRNIVAWFKTMTTNAYIHGVKQSGWPPFPGKLWHRNYYEHIVRNDADLARIRAYIRDNPANDDVLRFGEPRFIIGNRALLNLPKTAFLASRRTGGPMCPPSSLGSPFPAPPECVISGFLSPMERDVFKACLADGTPMIHVLACGLPKTFPPQVQRAIDAGRLLVMTPFDETIARVNAARAAWCNQYLLHAADRIVIGHLNPDGMLACLLADMPADKPIFQYGRPAGRPADDRPAGRP